MQMTLSLEKRKKFSNFLENDYKLSLRQGVNFEEFRQDEFYFPK